MNALLVAFRIIHYASAMLLFGELVFALAVAKPAFRLAHVRDEAFDRRFFAVARWSLLISVVSGTLWFAVTAAIMSGRPIAEVITQGTLGVVLGDTVFGRAFAVRLGLAAGLAVLLVLMRRSTEEARRSRLAIIAAAAAAAFVGSLAWVGHAFAGDASDEFLRTGVDIAHLLAAGAWLGALPALAFMLGRTSSRDAAPNAARRFSTLGVASVGVLIASGVVNAFHQVGDFPVLLGTDYGRLLVAKLALFAVMLGLATVNRSLSTRRLAADDRDALPVIRRNTILEIVLGLGVISIVGVLGVTVPAVHQPPIWPFDLTFTLDAIRDSAWRQLVVVAAGAVALISAVALLAGALGRTPRLRPATLACLVVSGGVTAFLLGAPAHPTTYVASPVRYTADAIASGSVLYSAKCSVCHDPVGRADETALLSPPQVSIDLDDRVTNRREGDLFWSIAHGVAGTSMPGFAQQLNDREIWSLIQYLDARTAARNALAMADRVRPLRPVPAPDFTFEAAGGTQQSLRQPRGHRVALLVFYTIPSSLPRLRELAKLAPVYAAAGARIIALPMEGSSAVTMQDTGGFGESMHALASPAVATTYLMFARQARDPKGGAPAHVEYLVDRYGFLRVRWIGVPEGTPGRPTETLAQIEALAREPPGPPIQWGHRH